MNTVTKLISAAALATASAALYAAETQIPSGSIPFAPFAMTESQHQAIARQHKMIAEQERAFAEKHAAAFHKSIEAQRKLAEQMTTAPLAPTPFAPPLTPVAPFSAPEVPQFPAPFDLSDLPATPNFAGMDRESRRTEIRKHMEQRREAMRARMQEQRDAVIQERDRYLNQTFRTRPQV